MHQAWRDGMQSLSVGLRLDGGFPASTSRRVTFLTPRRQAGTGFVVHTSRSRASGTLIGLNSESKTHLPRAALSEPTESLTSPSCTVLDGRLRPVKPSIRTNIADDGLSAQEVDVNWPWAIFSRDGSSAIAHQAFIRRNTPPAAGSVVSIWRRLSPSFWQYHASSDQVDTGRFRVGPKRASALPRMDILFESDA
jgi:hypothetical protein